MGLLMQSIILKMVFSLLTFLLFYEGYTSIEGREDYFPHWCVMYEKEENESFVKTLKEEEEGLIWMRV
jgi:hypothetical protein